MIEKHRAERALAGYTISVSPMMEKEFIETLRGLLEFGGRVFPENPYLHAIARVMADGKS